MNTLGKPKYYILYKPFGMLCQFSKEGKHSTLADIAFNFPIDVYTVGRLDADSEGLLILTNDNYLKNKVLDPLHGHNRTYLVQIEGEIDVKAIESLEAGVMINVKGKIHHTKPCKALILKNEPEVPERNPPIRFRKSLPTSWIRLTLKEGKNRQVRKMTAAVGFPTLRLIRESIDNLTLDALKPSEVIDIDKELIYNKLNMIN